MNDCIHDDPERVETLAKIAAHATAKMGHDELTISNCGAYRRV
jgi:hypothetical protein